jgi:hypothetical protein
MSTSLILDMTAGSRRIWFAERVGIFVDQRWETMPHVVASWGALPFRAGVFDLVVFDPPHGNLGTGDFAQRYGRVTISQLMADILAGAREARRVSRAGALMALKWATHDVGLQRVLSHLVGWQPLFGHKVGTRTRHKSDVYWCLLRRE